MELKWEVLLNAGIFSPYNILDLFRLMQCSLAGQRFKQDEDSERFLEELTESKLET